MSPAESFTGDRREKKLSNSEQTEVEWFKDWYESAKQNKPNLSEADFRKTIISGLGYKLNIPGYGLNSGPNTRPTEAQQKRLEELYEMVVGKEEEPNEWEKMAKEVEATKKQEKKLSNSEQTEVEWFKDWYESAKQNKPNLSEADFRKTIISGLGYKLNIPGYGLNSGPNTRPTEAQQKRLEELYEMVVGKE